MSTWLLASHEFNSLLSNIILENFSSQKHQNEFSLAIPAAGWHGKITSQHNDAILSTGLSISHNFLNL